MQSVQFSLLSKLTVFAMVFPCVPLAAQMAKGTLTPATEQTLTLAPGDSTAWTVDIPQGQVLTVAVEQLQSTVTVRWQPENGSAMDSDKRTNRSGKQSSITFHALGIASTQASANATLGVLLVQNEGKRNAEYRIKAGGLHSAGPADSLLTAAEREEMQGSTPAAKESVTERKQRLHLLQEAEAKWRKAGMFEDLTRTITLESFTLAFVLNDSAAAALRLPELVELAGKIAPTSPTEAGNALKTAGFIYATQAMYKDAMAVYNDALPLFERTDDTYNRVTVLENRAKVERIQGQNALALADVEVAIPLAQQDGDSVGELALEVERGAIASASGELGTAYEADLRAVSLAETSSNTFLAGLAWSDLGVAYTELDQFKDASDALDRADAIWKQTPNRYGEIQTTDDRAELRLAEGDLKGARNAFAAGVETTASLPHEHSYFLRGLAVSEMRLGRLDLADAHLHQASEEAESAHSNDTLAPIEASYGDLKAQQHLWPRAAEHWRRAEKLAEEQHNALQQGLALAGLVRAAVATGDLEAAGSECGRAMNALESVRGQIPNANLRLSFFSSRHALYDLCVQTALRRGDQQAAFDAAERGRARALLDQASTTRVSSAHATELMVADPLTQEQIVHGLDAQTALIAYWQSSRRGCVWLVTSHGASVHSLPSAPLLEKQIKHYLDALLAPVTLSGSASAAERTRALAAADASSKTRGLALRAALLPMHLPPAIRRLLIVTDGAIQTLSLGSLPMADGQYVGQRFQLATEPSASFVLRHRSRNALPFARLRSVAFTDASLPFAEQEKHILNEIFGVPQTQIFEGAGASRSNAVHLDWSSYDVAHFATHAVYRSAHPELSGLLLASDSGTKQSLLSFQDVLQMKAPLELVVLGACGSGEGTFIPGEGKLALDNAFLAAGAARVISTLWPVDDEATSVFMSYFYRALRSTHSPIASLQQAERQMARSVQWSAPYYWGAFVMTGDWTPLAN